jgi:DME family drug/metabolite transporter
MLVVVAALLWSAGGVGIKAVDEPALKIAFYRSAFAAVTLLLVFRPSRLPRRPSFLAAVFCYAGCLITYVVATKWTTAANAIFLQFTGVVWVLIAAPLILKEPRRPPDSWAIGIAMGGMALFFVGKLETRNVAGDLMALLSSFLFAFLIISLRRERGSGAESVVAFGNVLAAVGLLPFVAGDLSLSARSLTILGLLGVFQLAGGYSLFVRGLRYLPAARASLIGMLEPVANPIWVFLFLGERPSRYAIAGAAIVLAAVAWRTIVAGAPAAEAQPPD